MDHSSRWNLPLVHIDYASLLADVGGYPMKEVITYMLEHLPNAWRDIYPRFMTLQLVSC